MLLVDLEFGACLTLQKLHIISFSTLIIFLSNLHPKHLLEYHGVCGMSMLISSRRDLYEEESLYLCEHVALQYQAKKY